MISNLLYCVNNIGVALFLFQVHLKHFSYILFLTSIVLFLHFLLLLLVPFLLTLSADVLWYTFFLLASFHYLWDVFWFRQLFCFFLLYLYPTILFLLVFFLDLFPSYWFLELSLLIPIDYDPVQFLLFQFHHFSYVVRFEVYANPILFLQVRF